MPRTPEQIAAVLLTPRTEVLLRLLATTHTLLQTNPPSGPRRFVIRDHTVQNSWDEKVDKRTVETLDRAGFLVCGPRPARLYVATPYSLHDDAHTWIAARDAHAAG